jgi:ABC-2 type transport system permease protein
VKFFSLFKKEMREMMSPQTILMLVMLVILMVGMGAIAGDSMDEADEESSKITICDLDNTDFTETMISFLKNPVDGMENTVVEVELESDDYSAELDRLKLKSVVIIPKGFTESVNNGEQAEIIYVSKMTSLAMRSNINMGSETAVSLINSAVQSALYTNKVSTGKLTEKEVTQLNSPVNVTEQTIVGDKSAGVSQLLLYSSVYSQSLFMPLIVYILIMLGSQTMLSAVTAEKLDKTLETLLSAPISRLSVLSAKMLAAAVVAILNAAVYMIGMNGMSGSLSGADLGDYSSEISQLGLTFSTKYYILIGVQMLASTLIALSLSMILGAFAKNIKSSQTMLMPIMIVTIIPFMVSMFFDISSLPGAAKYLLYAIPFTHTFMASDCVVFGKTSLYLGGLIYQLIFLAVCMTIAIKIFTSDKIFTASGTSIGKKKHRKRKGTQCETED